MSIFGRGGLPRRRPDQVSTPPQGNVIGPGSKNVFRGRLVIIIGTGNGEFVYNAAGTQLLSANVGAVTTDPVLGKTVQQGFSTFNGFGAVINLLSTSKGAFFQYQDLGSSTQGSLILAVASTSGTDPVTAFTYGAGMTGVDPAFGDSITTVGASITLAQVAYTRNAQVAAGGTGGGANQPKLQIDAPEQTQASHLQMWLTGESPDASKVAQLIVGTVAGAAVLAPVTKALLDLQGTLGLTGIATPAAPPAGDALLFADAGGLLRMLRGLAGDTGTWALGHQRLVLANDLNSLGTVNAQTIFTFQVGIGSYAIRGYMSTQANQSAGAINLSFGGTAVAGGMRIRVRWGVFVTGGGGETATRGDLFTLGSSITSPVMSNGNSCSADYDGVITFTAAGTLTVTTAQTIAADTYVNKANSYAQLDT